MPTLCEWSSARAQFFKRARKVDKLAVLTEELVALKVTTTLPPQEITAPLMLEILNHPCSRRPNAASPRFRT